MKHIFYRNVRAREQFDIFFLSAIGSVLITRFYLELTNYPQIGGGGLHIAHMLWGGLLMAAGSILTMAFIGLRIQRLAALLSGVGFGFFIDEIGKFITSDNDYFFKPAIGIIYAVFVILYLTFNFLSRKQKLSSREYQLNALVHLEEAIVHDMEPAEKERAQQLLSSTDHRNPLTGQLQSLASQVQLVPEDEPRNITKLLNWLDRKYTNFWQRRGSSPLIRTFFIVETIIFVLIVAYGPFNNIDDIEQAFKTGTAPYDFWLLIGQALSSAVAAGFAIVGAFLLTKSRVLAFEQFRRATLINLLLTEFFIFSRVEFQALPGFLFQLGVLLFITYIIHQERRVHARSHAKGL